MAEDDFPIPPDDGSVGLSLVAESLAAVQAAGDEALARYQAATTVAELAALQAELYLRGIGFPGVTYPLDPADFGGNGNNGIGNGN